MVRSHHRERMEEGSKCSHLGKMKDRWAFCLNRNKMFRRRGSEAVTVYSIRYILAWRRSG